MGQSVVALRIQFNPDNGDPERLRPRALELCRQIACGCGPAAGRRALFSPRKAVFSPTGRPRIAQRFIAGWRVAREMQVPSGTTERSPPKRRSVVPGGTCARRVGHLPALKRWAMVGRPVGLEATTTSGGRASHAGSGRPPRAQVPAGRTTCRGNGAGESSGSHGSRADVFRGVPPNACMARAISARNSYSDGRGRAPFVRQRDEDGDRRDACPTPLVTPSASLVSA